MENTACQILDGFNALLPLKVVKAEPYWGTFVRIEFEDTFGNPIEIRSYLSDWILREGEKVIVTSNMDKACWNEPIAALAGLRLLELSVPVVHSLQLRFDSDMFFMVNENLEVYDSTDSLLTIDADERFNIEYVPETGFKKEIYSQ